MTALPSHSGETAAIDLAAYFRRVGFGVGTGGLAPRADLATLRALHARHLATIPFENLSPLLGMPVPLDPDHLHHKLVDQARGGYCFEHNLLFLGVLQRLGFAAEGLAARVRWNLPHDAPVTPRTHMLLRVRIDETDYLLDTGFGGMTPDAPLAWQCGLEQATALDTFRLRRITTDEPGAAGETYALEAKIGAEWRVLYLIDPEPKHRADFEQMNWFVATHPQSRFVNHLVVARPAAGARHNLFNGRYTIHRRAAPPEVREVDSVEALLGLLGDVFGIEPPPHPVLHQRLRAVLGISA